LACGGRDIDRWVAAELWPDRALTASMLEVAERLKCQLSSQEDAMAVLASAGEAPQTLQLDRRRLERPRAPSQHASAAHGQLHHRAVSRTRSRTSSI
jgi:hypothetical protein